MKKSLYVVAGILAFVSLVFSSIFLGRNLDQLSYGIVASSIFYILPAVTYLLGFIVFTLIVRGKILASNLTLVTTVLFTISSAMYIVGQVGVYTQWLPLVMISTVFGAINMITFGVFWLDPLILILLIASLKNYITKNI